MATLEKIRQRKKILAIVIGAALLAFIIEVGIEALGRQASNSTAAKVGSEKIDIMTFQKRYEKETAKDQDNPRASQADAAARQQQVLSTMISEKLLEKEYDDVGIYVTDNELSELMIGKNAIPAAQQYAQQVGAQSPAELNDILNNPSKVGADPSQLVDIRAGWEDLKNSAVEQYKMAKLQMLVAGGLQANDLDRKMMAEDEANTCYVNFVKKDYASLPDDKYAVTDQELKAEWEKMKAQFTLDEEARAIHYIAVKINPSPADIAMADKVADAAYAALQKGTGIDSVRVLGTVKCDTARYAADKVPANIKSFVLGAAVGATRRDSTAGANKYKMYKVTNKFVSLDSIEINAVAVGGAKSTQDSVLNMLNSGKNVMEIAKTIKNVQGDTISQWVQIVSYPDSIKSKLAAAGTDYMVLMSNDQGAQIVKVVNKKAPKTFYTVATITHEAYASQKTIDDLRGKLQDYLNANKTEADFAKNAAKAGFNAMEAMVTPSTPQLGQSPYGGGIKDTRKAIKWAFDSKKGEVSPIFSDNNDYFVAVALDDIYDGGYMPFNAPEVKDMLTARVRNAKKGADLMKQFEGKAKDLAGFATLMGAQVDTTQVTFGGSFAAKMENEPAIVGRIVGTKQGEVKLWKGENAVYAFQVTKVEKAQRQPSKQELDQRYSQQRGGAFASNPQAIAAILSKATKVERRLIDFY
ncbi:MAG: SurA N-terminal domain-containing protein [Muribaculaceae bacterium]|nr:SurA N-terminal domain-containing protein [Muribaculaceae bacterium]